MDRKRINPLSRRPRGQRLVVAVRGAAGTGKSVFAASMADAGLGRLCFFDAERKGRLLPGSNGTKFDAIEIEHPDELPEFIEWALDGEGREQGYGCYALDSWAMYFARKHRESLQAVRERTGDPLAQLSADELADNQVIFQEVLRRLCIDSGACVVITDQISAKGREDREENEMGQVLPMTTGGLEYFVDVMVELTLKLDGFEPVRVARVIKSNSPAFPIGLELVNPTFQDFLARLDAPEPAPEEAAEIPEALAAPEAEPDDLGPSLDELVERAEAYGVPRASLNVAARHYCGVADLDRLTPDQIALLLERMQARYAASGDGAAADAPPAVKARRSRKAVGKQ